VQSKLYSTFIDVKRYGLLPMNLQILYLYLPVQIAHCIALRLWFSFIHYFSDFQKEDSSAEMSMLLPFFIIYVRLSAGADLGCHAVIC